MNAQARIEADQSTAEALARHNFALDNAAAARISGIPPVTTGFNPIARAPQERALRALDAATADYRNAHQYPRIADRDLSRLHTLAKAVVDDVKGWMDRLDAIDADMDRPSLKDAVTYAIEGVFDGALTGDGFSVLAAECDVILSQGVGA